VTTAVTTEATAVTIETTAGRTAATAGSTSAVRRRVADAFQVGRCEGAPVLQLGHVVLEHHRPE
jgi:hypothetical protein